MKYVIYNFINVTIIIYTIYILMLFSMGIRERSLQDQLQRASALNIIINAIILWNTVYLTEAINHLKQNGELDEDWLPHVSPLAWEHINFLVDTNSTP